MAPCKNLQDLARQFEQDFPVGEFALPECSGTEDSSCHLDDIASEMGELESQLDSILREESELKCQQTKLEANIKKLESSLNEKVDWKKQLRELKKRKTKAEARLSQNDVDFMASIHKKLEAYKQITGIVWDYKNCNENVSSGYIFNRATNRVKVFEIDTTTYNFSDHLWDKIGESCRLLE